MHQLESDPQIGYEKKNAWLTSKAKSTLSGMSLIHRTPPLCHNLIRQVKIKFLTNTMKIALNVPSIVANQLRSTQTTRIPVGAVREGQFARRCQIIRWQLTDLTCCRCFRTLILFGIEFDTGAWFDCVAVNLFLEIVPLLLLHIFCGDRVIVR